MRPHGPTYNRYWMRPVCATIGREVNLVAPWWGALNAVLATMLSLGLKKLVRGC